LSEPAQAVKDILLELVADLAGSVGVETVAPDLPTMS